MDPKSVNVVIDFIRPHEFERAGVSTTMTPTAPSRRAEIVVQRECASEGRAGRKNAVCSLLDGNVDFFGGLSLRRKVSAAPLTADAADFRHMFPIATHGLAALATGGAS